MRGFPPRSAWRWAEAESYYRKALKLVQGSWLDRKFRSLFPAPEDEEPEYLLRRLAEAQARQRETP